MMTDPTVEAFEGLARELRLDVEKRRGVSKTDPAADALEYCADAITARLKALQSVEHRLTVDQYAKRENVTPQTVRTWIRSGQLPAIETAKGYLISAESRRIRPS